jgi:nicotinamide-nucleotide amidase
MLADTEEEIADAMAQLCARAGLVVATGGLGPTLDDVTRHAAARAAGVGLRVDAGAVHELEQWFAARGRAMPASNVRQALVPEGAQLLRNAAGTAPGFRLRVGDAWLAVLPGPPHEMRTVFEDELAPWLASLPPHGEVRRRAELQLFGLAESEFADRVGAWMERGANPRMGVLASSGLLSVKLVAAGPDVASAEVLLAARLAELRDAFGAWLVTEGNVSLAEVVARRLIASGRTLATAESCTGGLVAELLTRVPGISAVFLEGFVTYSNRAKVERLGVSPALIEQHGAVSAEVAAAMARGAAERAGARLAVSVTGIAGPEGGTPEKPVGLVHFGLCRDGELSTHERRFPPRGRERVREWAANAALELVRRALDAPR